MGMLTVENLKSNLITDAAGSGAPSLSYGVKFENAASSNKYTLDWYEEESWTPAFSATTPGTLSISYSTQWGKFTRIGNQVTALFSLVISAFTIGTASGSIIITGLPYPNMTGGYSVGKCLWEGIDVSTGIPSLYLDSATSNLLLRISTTNAAGASRPITNLANGDIMVGSITYFV